MATVSPPGEEPGFGHGSVLFQPSASSSVPRASLLLGKQWRCGAWGGLGSPSGAPDHSWSLLASGFPAKLQEQRFWSPPGAEQGQGCPVHLA